MPGKRPRTKPAAGGKSVSRSVSLKELAAHVGLSPSTLSLVLNASPAANSIPQGTKDKIFEAARGLNYRPHFFARSLRTQRSYTLGVLVPEISGGYAAEVLSGIEEYLLEAGYFYIVACHRHDPALLDEYPKLFLDRCVEGIIAVDTPCDRRLPVPFVAVSGHSDIDGIANIVINHRKAATLALGHLSGLGHRKIAFIKGQSFSSDTAARWEAIRGTAESLGIPISPSLVAQLEGDSPFPEVGYRAAQQLLAARQPFTALFAFNDISAIGAIRALREAGFSIPQEISIVGFDDIHAAAFHHPALTTIRQPLARMGRLAAQTLLKRISSPGREDFPRVLTAEPELVIRQSSARAPRDSGTIHRAPSLRP